MLDLDVCREDEDAGLRKLLADRVRRLEPLGRVRGRHPDVDDHELGLVVAHELDQLVRVARLADDLEVGSLEQACEPPRRRTSSSATTTRLRVVARASTISQPYAAAR